MKTTTHTSHQKPTPSRCFEEASQSCSKARFGIGKGFLPPHAKAWNCLSAVPTYPDPQNGGFGMKREELVEKVDDALANLEQAIANGESDELKEYLGFLSRFHNYSFGNVMLIYMQYPEATFVAGFQKWKTMKRHVKKGERGIRILAPLIRKKQKEESGVESDDDTQAEKVITGFRAVSVFDVSQTAGEELPTIQGYSGDPAENLERLKQFASEKGIEIVMEDSLGGAMGVSENGMIRLLADLEPADTFAVLTHEVAHELLHKGDRRKETTKSIRETEAEAVAFAVCSAVGLDAGSRAADYIQLHQGDVEKLRTSLEHIRETASEILGALQGAAKCLTV